MRGVLIAVVLASVGACSWGSDSGTGGGVDANLSASNQNQNATCGDGVCAASEVNSCPEDCGTGGNGDTGSNGNTGSANNGGSGSNAEGYCGDFVCDPSIGENSTTCPQDCSADNGSGTTGGSGSLDCSDETVIEACLLCDIGAGCSGVDATSCAACGF